MTPVVTLTVASSNSRPLALARHRARTPSGASVEGAPKGTG